MSLFFDVTVSGHGEVGSSAQGLPRLKSRCWPGLPSPLGFGSSSQLTQVAGRSHFLAVVGPCFFAGVGWRTLLEPTPVQGSSHVAVCFSPSRGSGIFEKLLGRFDSVARVQTLRPLGVHRHRIWRAGMSRKRFVQGHGWKARLMPGEFRETGFCSVLRKI